MIGGLSMTELIIILGLALLLLGPDQLPQLAKQLGKGLREIRKATDDLKGQFEQEIARIDLDAPPKMIAPVPPQAVSAEVDPAAARAHARMAAAAPPVVAAAADNPAGADDPAGARAAARQAAASSEPGLKLVAPEGTVAREQPPEATLPEAPAPAAAEAQGADQERKA